MRRPLMKIIAVLEILGGVVGLAVVFVFSSAFLPSPFAVILGALMFSLAILAGILLWRERPIGCWLSFVIQVLQIPWLAFDHLYYRFVAGVALTIGLRGDRITLGSYLGGVFNVAFERGDDVHQLNVIALGACLYLARFLPIWHKPRPAHPEAPAPL